MKSKMFIFLFTIIAAMLQQLFEVLNSVIRFLQSVLKPYDTGFLATTRQVALNTTKCNTVFRRHWSQICLEHFAYTLRRDTK